MTEEFLTPDHWLELLLVNVNGEMDDAQFRAFVRHNLSTVIGHKRLHDGLVERGRIQGIKKRIRSTGDFRDAPMQKFHEK